MADRFVYKGFDIVRDEETKALKVADDKPRTILVNAAIFDKTKPASLKKWVHPVIENVLNS